MNDDEHGVPGSRMYPLVMVIRINEKYSTAARMVGFRSAIAIFASAFLLLAAPTRVQAQEGTGATKLLQPRRFATDSFWLRSWYRGGSNEAELLTEPRELLITGGVAVVFDPGLREVTGFDVKTGASRFKLVARGEGPGEFKRPGTIVANGSRGFAVVDHATSRLTAFDSNGKLAWDTPLVGTFGIESLCIVNDKRVVLKRAGTVNSIATVDTSGREVNRRSLPWADPGEKTEAMRSFLGGPDSRGNCILVRRYGSEFLLVPPSGAMTRISLINQNPEATVVVQDGQKKREGTSETFVRRQFVSMNASVSNIMLLGDTLIIRGADAEREGRQLLDYYVLPTGRYAYSRKLPTLFIAVAVGQDGTFFGTVMDSETGGIFAFKPSATKPLPKKPATVSPMPAQPARVKKSK